MAKQVDYKAVGLRIKTLRLKNNIYQTELAKNIGVSQTRKFDSCKSKKTLKAA